VAPSGLYARLCHAFLVLILFSSVQYTAKRLTGKTVSKTTSLVSNGALNLNSVSKKNQSISQRVTAVVATLYLTLDVICCTFTYGCKRCVVSAQNE